ASAWTALTVKGGDVTVRGLRFEIDAHQAPMIVMAAVKVQDGGRLHLKDCEFVQVDPPYGDAGGADPIRLSSLVVENASATLAECYFVSLVKNGRPLNAIDNQSAVTLGGGATVEVHSCAFAPHSVLFHLRKSGGADPKLTVSRCSALMLDGTAFQVD